MSTKRAPISKKRHLPKADLEGEELAEWIALCTGETPEHCASKEEAVAYAKEAAEGTPGLIIALYRLEHYVTARVQAPQLYDAEPSK